MRLTGSATAHHHGCKLDTCMLTAPPASSACTAARALTAVPAACVPISAAPYSCGVPPLPSWYRSLLMLPSSDPVSTHMLGRPAGASPKPAACSCCCLTELAPSPACRDLGTAGGAASGLAACLQRFPGTGCCCQAEVGVAPDWGFWAAAGADAAACAGGDARAVTCMGPGTTAQHSTSRPWCIRCSVAGAPAPVLPPMLRSPGSQPPGCVAVLEAAAAAAAPDSPPDCCPAPPAGCPAVPRQAVLWATGGRWRCSSPSTLL